VTPKDDLTRARVPLITEADVNRWRAHGNDATLDFLSREGARSEVVGSWRASDLLRCLCRRIAELEADFVRARHR
jgi:hypothetical protein